MVRIGSGEVRRAEKRFALCIQNRGADDLEVRKVYRVLPDKIALTAGYLRVLDDSGEDYLYPADYFGVLICRRRRGVPGRALGRAPVSDGDRRTSLSTGPALALLAPAGDRER